ncbi:MAG: phosphotransferase [Flammeovirgaceae bacterium]|nr:phosphotransferase [Flammeovirgaceae bacterium]
MNNIPVTDSTISGDYLSVLLREHYGFSSNTKCNIFRTGINHSYIVTTPEQKYVLRIYSFQWRTALEISEEIRLLNQLKEHNISVSYPILNLHNEYILELQAPEGLRYGVLFSFAEGRKVREFSVDTGYNIGKLMAQLHQVTQNLSLQRITYNADSLVLLAYDHAKVHFSETNEEMQFINQAVKVIEKEFSILKPETLRKGVVHLDIWYDNMHIKNESEMTIFDFDFCGNGWLLHDIAYFIMQMYHHEADKKLYNTKKAAFFSGYESITSISEEEKKLLPFSGLSIWIFYLGVQSQRFDNWSNLFLSENFLKRFMGMAKDWLKFNGIEIKVDNKK